MNPEKPKINVPNPGEVSPYKNLDTMPQIAFIDSLGHLFWAPGQYDLEKILALLRFIRLEVLLEVTVVLAVHRLM